MQVIYYHKQIVDGNCKKNQSSGYICPFINKDCVHLDSLSMTKTIICNHCENFIQGKIPDHRMKIPVLGVINTLKIQNN
jgi:transcription elongation factor Elf1